MIIKLIAHSGFYVELERVAFLIDYWKGELPRFTGDKGLMVLASHAHPDHFNPGVLSLPGTGPETVYVFSEDIRKSVPVRRTDERIHFMRSREDRNFRCGKAEVRVRTLRSTDQGVAFLWEAEGRLFYHAGDLNWWAWDDDTPAESESMRDRYQTEIDYLASLLDGRRLEAAFLPLDPRLEEGKFLGFDYFARHIDACRYYPMHFWETKNIGIIRQLKEQKFAALYRDKVKEYTFS